MKRLTLIISLMIVCNVSIAQVDSGSTSPAESTAEPTSAEMEEAVSMGGSSTMLVGEEVESSDLFRKSGKIFVVVGVLVIIFSLLLMYLIHLERKLKRLEKF